jgi:hypothetical protein
VNEKLPANEGRHLGGLPVRVMTVWTGKLQWTITATGGDCTTSASRTVPIRHGADGNPWGLIWIEPDASGDLTYSVQIGPWPEAYEPRFTHTCRKEVPGFAGIGYAVGQAWWNHPEGVKVGDEGKLRWGHIDAESRVPSAQRGTIKDSLTSPHPLGTIKWVWDFKLVR